MSKRPFKDFDLPTKHIISGNHWKPPKTRDKAEEERRKGLPTGTLLTEYQHRGLKIAATILGIVQEPRDIESANSFITPAGLNTSWYSFARDSLEVMRRRLKLAELATADPEQRPTTYMLHHEATDLFGSAVDKARGLVIATQEGLETVDDYKKRIAQTIGHASLVLDSAPIGDQVGYGEIEVSDFDLQNMSRLRGLQALERARTLHEATGEVPSIGGLADPDSGISVFLRRQATNAVVDAYEEAYETAA